MKTKDFHFRSKTSRAKVSRTAKKTVKARYTLTLEVAPYLKGWTKTAKKDTCVVCGEDMLCTLDTHHINPHLRGEKRKAPENTVLLCASCHRIIDKKGTAKDFLKRHKRVKK